jgi:hypothetical protein
VYTTFDAMKQFVARFCALELNPRRAPFRVHGLYGLSDFWKTEHPRQNGCYQIFDPDRFLIYVGQTTAGFGSRIGSHLSPSTQACAFWQKYRPGFISVIPTNETWEAVALEQVMYPFLRSYIDKGPGRTG